ncbi:hypothetical protein PJ985_13235 [Streptomyces sp. ACA25]|uniref:hypothetical protein n=1 Tax=Streptomyces sp. ACA25 TaxID=3022596 RepID=UPI00230712B2|nr:hypothetical protein [Streptomyces sp. ACA25]MDB1088531.1 hypothetical protein [Streptomyces sp. ACA25]
MTTEQTATDPAAGTTGTTGRSGTAEEQAHAAELAVERITRTCLYEGYLLWPYRRSALKNAKRWTFGGVFPGNAIGEPTRMRTEVLHSQALSTGPGPQHPRPPAPPAAEVAVRVRFLQIVDRQVLRHGPRGPERVDQLTVDDRRYVTWQEATEREITADGRLTPVDIPAGTEREPVLDASGRHVGTLERSWQHLTGTVEISETHAAPDTTRIRVQVTNTTPAPRDGTREDLCRYAFASTHTVLRARSGHFVSLIDPPERLRPAAAACENQGAWPVLVNDEATVLSSPVTLYDYPAVAPESPGDLYDGTEIDRLLILSVLSMTDEEQAEARASDPRAREILDRCAALGPQELLALHGTIREFRPAERS